MKIKLNKLAPYFQIANSTTSSCNYDICSSIFNESPEPNQQEKLKLLTKYQKFESKKQRRH